jgi:nitrile hydratase
MSDIVTAPGDVPTFRPGSRVQVDHRSPIGHYRVPQYLRGKTGIVESVIAPRAVDNEEEGYGRNAGCRLHYYRIVFAMSELWPAYSGPSHDNLRIEVYETWLQEL